MLQDFEKLAKVEEEMEKQGFFGTVLKAGLGAVGKGLGKGTKWVAKNPLKTLGAAASTAFTAMDMGSAARKASEGLEQSKVMRGIPPPTD